MPRVIGPSQTLPGAVDVETDDGRVLPVEQGTAARLGLQMPAAPVGAELGQGQPGGMGASAPIAQGGVPSADPTGQSLIVPPSALQQEQTEAAPQQQGQVGQQFAQAIGGETAQIAAQEQGEPAAEQAPQQPVRPAGMAGFGVGEQAQPPAGGQARQGGGVDEQRLRTLQALTAPQGGGGIPTRQQREQAGTQTVTTSRTGPNVQSPDEARALEQAAQRTGQARQQVREQTEQRLGAEVQAEADRVQALADAESQLRDEAAQTAELVQRQQDTATRMQQDIDQAIAEIPADVDPSRIFTGAQGTSNQIVGAIAMGLGGLASGLTGGPNAAAQLISNAIDRDIDAQRAEMRAKGQQAQQRQNLFSQMLARHGDERAAQQAAKAVSMQAAKKQLERIAQQSQSDVAAERAQEMLAQMDAQQAEASQQAVRQAVGDVTIETTREEKESVEQRQQTGGPGRSLADRLGADPLKIAEFVTEDTAGVTDKVQKQVNDLGKALQDAGVVEAQALLGDLRKDVTQELSGEVDQPVGPVLAPIFDFLRGTPMRGMIPDEANKFRQTAGDILTVFVKARSGAQVTDKERQFLEDTIGLSTSATDNEVANGMRLLAREMGETEKTIRGRFPDQANAVFNQRRFNWHQRSAGGGLSSLQSGVSQDE